MSDFTLFSEFVANDMALFYFEQDGILSFGMVPLAMREQIVSHRRNVNDSLAAKTICRRLNIDFAAVEPESMIQFKLTGDTCYARNAPGDSMRNSGSIESLTMLSQRQEADLIITEFKDCNELYFSHIVHYGENLPFIEVSTSVEHRGEVPVTFEMFSSFSLGMLSLFQPDDGPEKYMVHRFHSLWSGEGRHSKLHAEDCNLEMSWQASSFRGIRFGQRGSLPTKTYAPFAGLEDIAAGVIWGAQLEAIGPWMLEVTRSGDFISISGGIPDREFAGWTKRLNPGETFVSPTAILSCACGDIQDLTARLIAFQEEPEILEVERNLPVMFNDWCCSWGFPSEDNLRPLCKQVAALGVKYFILDTGWHKEADTIDWGSGIGDWKINEQFYHGGFASFMQFIRSQGLVPGIWFEFENCTENSTPAREEGLLLKLDGIPIKVGNRRFLDFRKEETLSYLKEKVIAMLRKYRIGYIKVDNNAQMGCGCDGNESPLENLFEHLRGVEKFLAILREELPELVIEVCASGGHRLSPWWLRRASLSSGSDAHEGVEIPIIAANVQQLVPASKAQVWVVVHGDDTSKRLAYSFAAGMLGRMCISGDIGELNAEQLAFLKDAVEFYREAAEIIRYGKSRRSGKYGRSYTSPHGWQLVRRKYRGRELIVVHTFAESPRFIELEFSGKIINSLQCGSLTLVDDGGKLQIDKLADFNGLALLVENSKA